MFVFFAAGRAARMRQMMKAAGRARNAMAEFFETLYSLVIFPASTDEIFIFAAACAIDFHHTENRAADGTAMPRRIG